MIAIKMLMKNITFLENYFLKFNNSEGCEQIADRF